MGLIEQRQLRDEKQFKSRINCIAELIRIDNCLTASAYTLVGVYLSTGFVDLFTTRVVRTVLLVGLMVAFSCVVNDYKDVLPDSFGKPDRPIPSGRISRRTAGILALALASTSLGIATTLGPQLLALSLSCIILSAAYSYKLKETLLLGNATVAFLEGTIPFYGGLAAGRLTPAVWAASLLTFLYTFAQEILYTVEDEKGDRCAGLRTTATRLGMTDTVRLFQVCAIIFVAAALAPWVLGLAPDRYLYAIVPCSILPILRVMFLLGLKPTDRTIHLAVYGTWYVWFSSLLPIVLLR
jgi:geranylgeranylglycerol-phosphate geranylgeranyltransferase